MLLLIKRFCFQKFSSVFAMEMFADLFNATLAYNPFNALFSDSVFTGSEVTSMLQSGLFMSFISLCHYWEVNGFWYENLICNPIRITLVCTGMEHNSLQFHLPDVHTHAVVNIARAVSWDRSVPFVCISTTVFTMGNLLHGVR